MAHLDRRFSQKLPVLVYVERLTHKRAILWNGHQVALGKPGEYWCTWDGCEWIESRESYRKHYRVVWQMDLYKTFCATMLTSTVAQTSFQVFLKGRDNPAICIGHPHDKLLEFASGASYILRQESRLVGRVLTPYRMPLYVNTGVKKLIEIT